MRIDVFFSFRLCSVSIFFRCFLVASNAYINACSKNVDNCVNVLLSNRIVQILEFLMNRLNVRTDSLFMLSYVLDLHHESYSTYGGYSVISVKSGGTIRRGEFRSNFSWNFFIENLFENQLPPSLRFFLKVFRKFIQDSNSRLFGNYWMLCR